MGRTAGTRTPGIRYGSAGDGWGGPAKGPGNGNPRQNFAGGGGNDRVMDSRASRAPGEPSKYATDKERAEARARELKDHLYHLARRAEREETQVRATEAWLNRHEGMPVARNVNLNVNDAERLTDDELRAELARLGGAVADPAAGDAPPAMPGEPADVVR